MPGSRNILMGGGVLLLGLLITGATYSAASPGGHYVIASGAIAFGGLQLVIGLGQAAIYQMRTPEGRAKHHAEVGTRVILRSMISMAAADGVLHESEIVIIQMISNAVFGQPIAENLIKETFETMSREGSDLTEELVRLKSQVVAKDADLAIKAIAMVALSDGRASEEEKKRLADYALALQIGDVRFARCVDDAKQTIADLLRAQSVQRSDNFHPANNDPALASATPSNDA